MDAGVPPRRGKCSGLALQEVERTGPATVAPRPKTEKVIVVITLGNYSHLAATICRSSAYRHGPHQASRQNSTFSPQKYKIQSEIDILISPLAQGSSGEKTPE